MLQATAISDRWGGAAHYGRLNGLLSAPSMIATAVAPPWAGAALAAVFGGYTAVFWLLAAVAAAGAVLALGSIPARARSSATPRPRVDSTDGSIDSRKIAQSSLSQ